MVVNLQFPQMLRQALQLLIPPAILTALPEVALSKLINLSYSKSKGSHTQPVLHKFKASINLYI